MRLQIEIRAVKVIEAAFRVSRSIGQNGLGAAVRCDQHECPLSGNGVKFAEPAACA